MKQLRRIASGLGGALVLVALFIGVNLVVGIFNKLGAWLMTLAPTFFGRQSEATFAAFFILFMLTVGFIIGYYWAKDREPSDG
jgi:H+/Cl- antiporter ClcA